MGSRLAAISRFRVLPSGRRDVRFSHVSQNIDRSVANLHVTSFRIVSGTLEELLELLREPGGFVDILRAANGFRQYSLADVGRGEVTTVSVWDSADDAEAVSGVVGAWMQEKLSGRVEMTYMAVGDVALFEDMG